MGRIVAAIVVVILILTFLAWAIHRWYRQDDKRAGRPVSGDLNARQEKVIIDEADKAAELLRLILSRQTPADPWQLQAKDLVILPDDLQTEIVKHLSNHEIRKAHLK